MIRQFGKRIGHIRRQSECEESPCNVTDKFRNRSQSLDSQNIYKHDIEIPFDSDCETTYRIYESILHQGITEFKKSLLPEFVLIYYSLYSLFTYIIENQLNKKRLFNRQIYDKNCKYKSVFVYNKIKFLTY
jgi:hypothetical protein